MKTIVCSHGFGVDKTGRGLFTDIAKTFPDCNFVMFDYNDVQPNGDMTMRSLDVQARILEERVEKVDGKSVILAHSQGCIVAAMSRLKNIEKIIFLAPPDNLNTTGFSRMFERDGAKFNLNGTSILPRRDGTTTYIGRDYLDSIKDVDIKKLFKAVNEKYDLTLIKAADDEVVGQTDFSYLKNVIQILGDHNFTGEYRKGLLEKLALII